MKIAVACGGTGGHVYPGISVANELTRRGHSVTILGTGRSVEAMALQEWTGETALTGPLEYASGNALLKLLRLWGSRHLSISVFRSIEPDVLLAMGGYASVGPVMAASKLGVPVILHEGNAVPGKALRFLTRFAKAVAVNFESTVDQIKSKSVKATGFPVRRSVLETAKKPRAASEVFNVLVIGGSQGAGFLNEVMPGVMNKLLEKGHRVHAVHVAGEDQLQLVEKAYKDMKVPAEVYGFVNGMNGLYERANMAVARSGASVCAELAVFGIPSLMIPYPYAAEDHQTANAAHYVLGGGAKLVPQEEFEEAAAISFIEDLIGSTEHRRSMSDGMLACAVIDASSSLSDLVEETRNKYADI